MSELRVKNAAGGEDVFTVQPLLGEQSFLLQPLIAPAVADCGSLFGLFARAFSGEVGESEAMLVAAGLLDEAGPVIARLAGKLPPETLRTITRTLLAGATMNGVELYQPAGNPIDILLRGRTLDFWRLLIHAMRSSYPDFFGLLKGRRAPPVAGAPSATSGTSSPGSAGGSG